MNTYRSTNTDDSPGLTLEHLLAAVERLEALLPVVHYHTHENAPLRGNGTSLVAWFNRIEHSAFFDVFDAPVTVETLVILHPDNLPELQRQARGRCRLMPLAVSQ